MIRSVKEVYEGTKPHGQDGLTFWSYLICRNIDAGRRYRYDLIRIDNVCENMQVLGRELPIEHCRQIIKKHEPGYVY